MPSKLLHQKLLPAGPLHTPAGGSPGGEQALICQVKRALMADEAHLLLAPFLGIEHPGRDVVSSEHVAELIGGHQGRM